MARKIGATLIADESPLQFQGDGEVAQLGSPGAAEEAGATPDQAKMVNTQQALKGLSSKIALRAKDTLAGAKRLREPKKPSEVTLEEQAYTDRLKRLGGLGANIQRLVDKSIEDAAKAETKIEPNELFLKSLPKDKQDTYTIGLQGLNEALASGSDIQDAMANFKNSMLPDPEKGETLPAGAIDNLMEGIERDIAGVVANQIAAGTINADEININTLLNSGIMQPEDLGLSEDELTKDLGANWVNMTPAQLSDAVDRVNAIKFGESDQLISMLNSPFISAAQQEDIKDRLWEMGFSGALQRESDIDVMAKQVEQSGIVEFAGEARDLDDLLSDEGMEEVIKDYINGDQADKDRFSAKNPQLAAYLDKNADSLSSSMKLLAESEATLNEILKENDKARTFGDKPGIKISDEALEQVIPGYKAGSFTKDTIKLDNPLFKYLRDNPKQASGIVETINGLAEVDPKLVKDAMDMAKGNPKELNKLLRSLNEDGPELEARARLRKGLDKPIQEASIDDVVNWLFGEDATASTVEQEMADAKAAAPFDQNAKFKYDQLSKTFDADGDGILDDPEDVYNRLKTADKGDNDLGSLLSKDKSTLESVVSVMSLDHGDGGEIGKLLAPYVSGIKGKLQVQDVGDLADSVSLDQLNTIARSKAPMTKEAKSKLINIGASKLNRTPEWKAEVQGLSPDFNTTEYVLNNPKKFAKDSKGLLGASADKIKGYSQNLRSALAKEKDPFKRKLLFDRKKRLDKFWEDWKKAKAPFDLERKKFQEKIAASTAEFKSEFFKKSAEGEA